MKAVAGRRRLTAGGGCAQRGRQPRSATTTKRGRVVWAAVVATCRDPVERFVSAVGAWSPRQTDGRRPGLQEALPRTLRNYWWNEHVIAQSHFSSCFGASSWFTSGACACKKRAQSSEGSRRYNTTARAMPRGANCKSDYDLLSACVPRFRRCS